MFDVIHHSNGFSLVASTEEALPIIQAHSNVHIEPVADAKEAYVRGCTYFAGCHLEQWLIPALPTFEDWVKTNYQFVCAGSLLSPAPWRSFFARNSRFDVVAILTSIENVACFMREYSGATIIEAATVQDAMNLLNRAWLRYVLPLAAYLPNIPNSIGLTACDTPTTIDLQSIFEQAFSAVPADIPFQRPNYRALKAINDEANRRRS